MHSRDFVHRLELQKMELLLFLLLLTSCGGGNGNPRLTEPYPGGWTNQRQQQVAANLAREVAQYRIRINERRSVNYGYASLEVTFPDTSVRSFKPTNPYEGFNSPSGANIDAHSEAKLKGWALALLRRTPRKVPAGAVVNLLIFTQVRVCSGCVNQVSTWAVQLQQAAGPVRVNLYMWQLRTFDPGHPTRYPIDDVTFGVSASAP